MFLIYFVFPKKVHLQDDFEISKTVKSYRKDSFVFLNIFWIYNISLYSKRHYLYDILKKKVWNHHLAMESSSSNGITIYCLKKKYRMLWRSFSKLGNLCLIKNILTLPIPIPGEEKINWNFYFYTSLGYLQRFYAGIKCLHKTLWGTTKKSENKNLTFILIQLPEMRGTGRVNDKVFGALY